MKKLILIIVAIAMMRFSGNAQQGTKELEITVAKLDKAKTVKDYKTLADDFIHIAESQKKEWLPFYYAAFCNAKIGWLYEDDGEKIAPFTDKAEEEIKKSLSLLDTASQKKELSELYCVFMMLNQARVFMNPQTYGAKYGPTAFNYLRLAEKANPENPRALYLEGWVKYATPKAWGGDKVKAKELLIAAKQELNSNASFNVNPHWGKMEVEDLLKQLK